MKVSELSDTDQKRLKAIEVKERLSRDDLFTMVALNLRLAEGMNAPGKDDVEKICMEFLDAVTRTVHQGKSVLITGFGAFAPEERKARKARNPQTGETMRAPARKDVKFSSGALFKQYLNGRSLPKTGPLIGKAPKNSGEAITDYAKAGVHKRRYIKKEKI